MDDPTQIRRRWWWFVVAGVIACLSIAVAIPFAMSSEESSIPTYEECRAITRTERPTLVAEASRIFPDRDAWWHSSDCDSRSVGSISGESGHDPAPILERMRELGEVKQIASGCESAGVGCPNLWIYSPHDRTETFLVGLPGPEEEFLVRLQQP